MALRGLFCTVSQQPGQGGIARVSAAIGQVLKCQYDCTWRVVVAAPDTDALTRRQKLRFGLQVLWHQLRRSEDALFFDHLGLATVQRWVPRMFRCRYGIFLHSIEVWSALDRHKLRTLQEAALRVANSRYTAKRIAQAHPSVGDVQVCHLALGLDRETFAPSEVLEEQHWTALVDQVRKNSVLIVGRMMSSERHKGHEELLRAWPFVLQGVPEAQLVVVGAGDDLEHYRSMAKQLGLAGHVLFTGRVPDLVLDAIYSRVAVFAMPSRAEGFGIVYLEAMRHRLACIASVHDAAGEIVVDGETGFLVDQKNLGELASRLIELLVDPALRSEFGRRGYERLCSHFSFQKFEARMTELLLHLQQ